MKPPRGKEKKHTQPTKLPKISLHTNTIISILLQKRQPNLHRLGVPVPDLNQPPQRGPLKVLLALLENEGTPGHRPPLGQPRQRRRPKRRQLEVVGRAEGKVAEEVEVGQAVRPQLQVAGRDAVLDFAPEGLEVQRLEGARHARAFVGGVELAFGDVVADFDGSVGRDGEHVSTSDLGLLVLGFEDLSRT